MKRMQFVLGLAIAALFAMVGYGQVTTADAYVISAKAGGINYVEGKVAVARADGKGGLLVKDDQIDSGDKVSTGSDARVEVLLNPGSYLRVGGDSAFEFVSTSLDDLRFKVSKGSAVIEVLASDEFAIGVDLPKGSIKLNRSGVFRVDILGDGTAKVSVWKGKLLLDGETEIKSGRYAIVGTSDTATAKFDRDGGDDLDVWSKLRAKEISAVNARLQRDSMRNSLLSSYNNGRWNAYNGFGVWVFDPFRRMWCFMPFGAGWGSPYGFDYYFNMWYCNMPPWVYTNGGNGNGNGGGTGGGGGSVPTVPNATREQRVADRTIPPFQRTNPDGVPSGRNENPNAPSPSGRTRRDDPDIFIPRTEPPRNDFPRSNPNSDTKPASSTPPPTPIIIMPSPKTEKDNN